MANYLLSMRFDIGGCTNKEVINLGGVSFNTITSLGRAAYFSPLNLLSGFQITNSHIKEVIETGTWCIYFKYKMKKEDLDRKLPIIAYQREDGVHHFLSTYEKAFILHLYEAEFYIDGTEYSFDNEWHTFYLLYENNGIKAFVDGYKCYQNDDVLIPGFGEVFYIGTNTVDANYSGYLNDFNIFEGVIYRSNFVPPTNYIGSYDAMTNYKDFKYATKESFNQDLIDSIERNREYTADRTVEYQKAYVPRWLKVTWKQIYDGYFNRIDYKFNLNREKASGIYINITGIDTNLLTSDNKYFSQDLESAVGLKKVYPLMIFINKKFVKLSKIKLIKSDDWYTLFIKDMPSDTIVESVHMILLPFPVIYEEDYGERSDLEPVYGFDSEGHFTPQAANAYYYIDKYTDPNFRHIGVREYFPDNPYENDNNVPINFMNFIWRYGKLQLIRVTETNGALMLFVADEYGHVLPDRLSSIEAGDRIILYQGSTMINPMLYTVMGHDLIYFEDLQDVALFDNRTVTMQIITDIQKTAVSPYNTILQDFTDMKIVDVEATKNKQSEFQIPDVVDKEGNKYRKFLVFKGHVFLEERKRYLVDYDTNILRFVHHKDYITIGRHLTFIFLKIKKVDAVGPTNVNPVFYYTNPDPNNLSRVPIPITHNKIKAHKHNCMVFVNDTFVSPYRYVIEDNTIIMRDFTFTKDTSVIVAMLEIANELNDTFSMRGKLIRKEINKGHRYVLYDLAIPKEIKITTNNMICFDKHGLLITDLEGYVYNYNIIKYLRTKTPLEIKPAFLTCVYRTDGFEHKTNLNRFKNEDFIRNYIYGIEEFYEMDEHFDEFIADFNFTHSKDLEYGENLSKSLDYILSYNQNKIDDIYEKNATAFIKRFHSSFNQYLKKENGGYTISIPRDEYDTNIHRTYPLFFINGLLANWDVTEDANDTLIYTKSLPPENSIIKSINFKGLSNFIRPLNSIISTDGNKEVEINISSKILVGKQLTAEQMINFYSFITIIDYYNTYFTGKIEVDDIFEPQVARKKWYKDILENSTVKLTLPYSIEFPGTCKLVREEDFPVTEINLDDYNYHYDFWSRIRTICIEQIDIYFKFKLKESNINHDILVKIDIP